MNVMPLDLFRYVVIEKDRCSPSLRGDICTGVDQGQPLAVAVGFKRRLREVLPMVWGLPQSRGGPAQPCWKKH